MADATSGSARGTRARRTQEPALIDPALAAKRPAGFQRRAGIAQKRSLLTGPHSDLSIFQNTGVAGPPSTPVSDFRHALGAMYCPSGM